MEVWHIPLTHPFEVVPSCVRPYQLHAPTSDPQQVPTPAWGNTGVLFCLSFSEKPLSFFLKLSTSRWASRGLQAGSDLTYVALFNEFINMCLTTLISSLAGPDAFSLSHSQLQSYAPILYCEEPRYLFIVWQLLLDTARTWNPTPGVWAKLFVPWAFMPSVS